MLPPGTIEAFGLFLVRTSALVLGAPIIGSGAMFSGYKVALIGALSVLLFSVSGSPIEGPVGPVQYALFMLREVGVPVDRLVVNGLAAAPFPPGLDELDVALGALPPQLRCGALPAAGVLAECAAFLRARHRLNARYREQVAERTGLPVLSLPLLPGGIGGADALAQLAAPLLADAETLA